MSSPDERTEGPPPESTNPTFTDIEMDLTASGLICRGGFHLLPADNLPAAYRTLVLVGNAGPAMWQAFTKQRRDEDDPLDAWTRRTLTSAAARLGAETLFPFGGPPHHPFQRWAQRAKAVFSTPIGPLIHPEYGLWHAYRGALAFAQVIPLPQLKKLASLNKHTSPCTSCPDKPCLTTCPVNAFGDTYDVPACVRHLETAAGADCMDHACRARRACPVGREYRYDPTQARFHMEKFLAARQRAGTG